MGTTSRTNEAARLAELHRLNILDTSPETAFDHITRLATEIFKAPIVLISMVDRERVWLKSHYGIDANQFQRKGSFSDLAMSEDDVIVIPDTRQDPRTSNHPFVVKKPGVRFYAAVPLRTRFGYNVGTLCIMDMQSRDLTEQEKGQLRTLGGLVVDEMELRLVRKPVPTKESEKVPAEPDSAAKELLQERQLFMGGPTVVFKWQAKENWPVEYVSQNVSQFGYEPEELMSGEVLYSRIVHPDDLERVASEVRAYSEGGADCFNQEYRIICKDGRVRWIYDFTVVIRDSRKRITHYHGYVFDITPRRETEEALRESWAKYEAAIESFDGQIYICSPDYKIEFMNKHLIDRTGYDGTGQDCYKVLHDRDSICPWCVNESVLRGKTVRWEIQSPKDNHWYYVVNTPIRHSDGTVSKMAMIQDVTQRKEAQDLLKRREAILEAVAFASEQFMRADGWAKGIREVLARMGQAAGVSRVYIFENHPGENDNILTSIRYEWVAPGTSPQIYNPALQGFNYEARGFQRWQDVLSKGRVIDGHVREFPEAERDVLGAQGTLSLVVVPVFVDKEWWGFVGLNSCDVERKWSPSELDALKTATGLFGAAIHRTQYEAALRNSEERNRVILDAIPDLIFRIKRDGTYIDFKADTSGDLAADPDAIIGRTIQEMLPKDVTDVSLKLIAKAIDTGERQLQEYELATIDGDVNQYEGRIVVSGPDEVLVIVRNVTGRKKAEAELQKLSQAVAQTADAVIVMDFDGVIEYVNPGFERLTGYTREDAVGETPAILNSGEHDEAFFDDLWAQLRKGEVVRSEVANKRKDGSLYYHGATITPVKDVAGRITHFVSVGRDVSEQMAAEEALKESEQRLGRIINFLPDATFAIDLKGRVIAWNRAIEMLTGIKGDEIIGQSDYEYALPLYGERRPILVDLVLSPDEVVERDYKYIERSGDTLIAEIDLPSIHGREMFAWVTATPLYDAKGNVVGAIECIRDITERKQAEEAIRKLAAFPQFNPNAVLEFSRDGTLSYYNRSAKEMAVLLGLENPFEMLPADARGIVQACLSSGENRERVECSIGRRTLSWSFFPILESETVHAYGFDITDRQNLEAQMRHLQKMEAVGRLAGGVAHDFNNILTAILGYSSMALLEEQLPEEAAKQIREIAKSADRASHLTRQLLAFSRKQVIQPRILDVNDVLASLSDMLHRLISEDTPLVFDYGAELPTVYADQSMIEQVMVNMVINARDAMPEGGKITIATSIANVDLAHVRNNAEARTGRFVKISVTDTGCGMDEKVKARIFEPFFTTKSVGEGTGLGLATVYGIVKQHDGWIEVASETGSGATFNVYLPVHSGVRRAAPQSSRGAAVHGGCETILVVEDEQTVRTLAASILAQYGYRVLEAASGAEGLDVWESENGNIDLVLTDVVMPGGLTGNELADRLQERKKDLKVILTSGYNPETVGQKFTVGEGVKFLPKPFSPSELAKAIRESLDN